MRNDSDFEKPDKRTLNRSSESCWKGRSGRLFGQCIRVGRDRAFLLDAGGAEGCAGFEITTQLNSGTGTKILYMIMGTLIEERADEAITGSGGIQSFNSEGRFVDFDVPGQNISSLAAAGIKH